MKVENVNDKKIGPISRYSKKTSRENEVFESDRVDMIDAANDLVENIIRKQIYPMMISAVITHETELCKEEQEAYVSALRFLTRQFDQGYSNPEPFERRVEQEESTEFSQEKESDVPAGDCE